MSKAPSPGTSTKAPPPVRSTTPAEELESLFAAQMADGRKLLDDLRLVLPVLRTLIRFEQENNRVLREIRDYLLNKFGPNK